MQQSRRNNFNRKTKKRKGGLFRGRRTAYILPALVIVLAVAAIGYKLEFSSSASIGNFRICDVYSDTALCVAAPNLSDTAPVVEGDGRSIFEDIMPNGHTKLKFWANTFYCVAASATNKVVVKDCGDTNDQWVRYDTANGHIKWKNVGTGLWLSGHNNRGSQYTVGSDGCNGCYQQFWNVVQ